MGSKFTQVLATGPSQRELVDFLQSRDWSASVGPTIAGYTVISDEACADFAEEPMRRLAQDLSKTLACACLGVHFFDEDILSYMLYVRGALEDEYNSCPDYSDFTSAQKPPRAPVGGDVEKLGNAFNLSESQRGSAKTALHQDINSEMMDGLSKLPFLFRGGVPDVATVQQLKKIMAEHMEQMQKKMAERTIQNLAKPDDGFDKAFPARWRYGHLLRALGAPEYAMDFSFGAEDEEYDLPPGSIIQTR